ncbi:amino acid ABC transporter permease [Clostridium sp. BL-8]|uniref:amino acid ABC transporter permease n=1 Tax=Clostridium sp. BL-8 TaxID=349938 RepID=UPI00098C4A51|nr:amino acid ABC transporter permease [Clostridium sp. BL-8]OOM76172.1 arginine transport system permease protein ArtQ [Clostridium sp. BL-8]
MNFSFLHKYQDYFLRGAVVTIILSFFAVFIGTILGLLLTLLRRTNIRPIRFVLNQFGIDCKESNNPFIKFLVDGNPIKFIASVYIEFVRGTPLLVQIYIIYIGVPSLLGINIPDMIVAAIALFLNSAAYVAEIIRAGIEAVDKGQMEAARSLGMNGRRAMLYIIIPQAFKNILPALGNEFIAIIKDSSMVSVIGVAELMYNANTVRGSIALGLEPVIVAAMIYFVITFTLTRILGIVERRMKASDIR